ncbi:MAG: NUDIX hydrolase [Candidatus Nomurabacteria bacterium]|jgi:8-oxo-dGTP diphosphatase|nr:NUDIX hydrolase [Candidatus Nomurabacteria bacterium]
MKYTTKYIAPTVTVDLALFQVINDKLNILLLNRPNDPFKGRWALPGGYVPQGETTLEALRRVIAYKVGIDTHRVAHLEQLHVFDAVARDPRGHAVAVTYSGYSGDIAPETLSQTAQFFEVDHLPPLVFDHGDIIGYALHRLRNRISYTNLAQTFMPREFTLTELQNTYQAILGKALDKRNFRKRIIGLDMAHETGQTTKNGAHRPAKLYTFNSPEIAVLKSKQF